MSDKKNIYRDTLNLPRTDFAMRAGLLQKEPPMQVRWRTERLYERIREERRDSPRFVLHDGPPYANGNIHMGTGLNKILKDMVVRLRTMEGMNTRYLPGWDCHGLPIEQKVMDELGREAARLEPLEIRRRCRDYAERFARLQSEQFQSLGVMGEFDDPYITMDPGYEAAVLEVFAGLVEQGLVYRQLKPVHWSIENQTALADAELEYRDREDPSIYVLFPVSGGNTDGIPRKDGDALHLMIWTTTPWTLPANEAVAVHPAFRYQAVHADTASGGITFLVAEDLASPVLQVLKEKGGGWLLSHQVLGTMTGQEILDLKLRYRHPIREPKECPLVPALYVTLDQGTGLVHTAPGHGLEDYATGLQQGLEVYCPVREDGTMDDTVPQWLQGMSVWKANPAIVEHLRANGLLAMTETILHSYPHDWRSRGPTIFRATRQWFIAVDRPQKSGRPALRQAALDYCGRELDQGGVQFIPAWGRSRITGMLESRPDWCISRQRAWGLPIPVLYNEEGEPLLTPASVRAVAAVFAQRGSDAWFELPAPDLLAGYDPHKDPDLPDPARFAPAGLVAGRDIFDVWFESGSSWKAVGLGRGLVEELPIDLYLEGSDQHRGWFQLSLLPALGSAGQPPFRTVLTHGFVVTEDGHKMSKSLGNAIDVNEQVKKRGADILRLWVASQNYQDDVRCSDPLIAQAEDAYRKIRNTLRFAMGACSDYDPAGRAEASGRHSIDWWMENELHGLIRNVRAAYDRYEFHRASRLLYEFCTVQASSVYFSAVKDRLYCEHPDAPRRRTTQAVIHRTLDALIRLLAPILPHTCEEAWEHVPHRESSLPGIVHLASLPEHDPAVLTRASARTEGSPAWFWDRLMEMRDQGLARLEAIRNAGVKDPLDTEAVVQVKAEDRETAAWLEQSLGEIADMLGVGFARMETVPAVTGGARIGVEIRDTREVYPRCARSWRRRPDVGSDPEYPDLSARDAAAVRKPRG